MVLCMRVRAGGAFLPVLVVASVIIMALLTWLILGPGLRSEQETPAPVATESVVQTHDAATNDPSSAATVVALDDAVLAPDPLDESAEPAVVRESRERFGPALSELAGSIHDAPDARATADRHPQTASAIEALTTGTHPERVTVLAMPAPFDRDAFVADPEAYLAVTEPGRVWQPAQPAADVERLQVFGPSRFMVNQGATVPLRVRTDPGMPVSFTSFDLGRFPETGLPNITVRANEQGYAEAVFEATAGTWEEVRILAASPVRSGQQTFVVIVQVPGLTD